MELTLAQQQTLVADIAADPVLGQLAHTADNAFQVKTAYNLLAVPDFYVYRTDIPANEVVGALDWTEMLTLSAVDLMVFQIMLGVGINASDPNIRAGILEIFSGPNRAITRAALGALAPRKATRFEALFATGTGTQGSPANLVLTGTLQYQDVLQAWEATA